MASLYSAEHRKLQAAFNTEKLANMLDTQWVHEMITEPDRGFISSRDMFFLSTVDPDGNPTVSYKGGPSGFVKVLDDHTLVFPGYNGNGMFLSMGNIEGQHKIGMLFIDFETPNRLRVQGVAKVESHHPLMAEFEGAEYLVVVNVTKVWVNCPRYIHKYQKVGQSKYVPEPAKPTPLASWKRLDMVHDVISDEDRQRALDEGMLSLDEYQDKMMRGDA